MIKRIAFVIFLLTSHSHMLRAEPAAPDVILYGLARNAFGFTYEENSNTEIILRDASGQEIMRRPVGRILASGVNYSLQVPMDLGYLINRSVDIGRYRDDALRESEDLRISISEDGVELPVMEFSKQNLSSSPSGTLLRVDLTTGTDADGDGLPDEWETYITGERFDDGIENIYDVLPDDDFDGDGTSNFAEYAALTLPNWAEDRFRITNYEEFQNGGARLSFTTRPGKSYQVYHSSDLSTWELVSFVESSLPGEIVDFFYESQFYERTVTVGPPKENLSGVKRYYRIGVK